MTIDEQIQWLEHKLDDCSASEGDVVDEIIATLKQYRFQLEQYWSDSGK